MSDPAPLLSIPGFGPPNGGVAEWITAKDGLRLRVARFDAAAPKGTVFLNNGRTEFIEKYYEVIGELLERDFTVVTHDWRGQGLSQRLIPDARLKGHANGAAPFLDDFDLLLARSGALPKPWIAVGHSMGGALTLLAALERAAPFDAVVLSSPMVGVKMSAWLAPFSQFIAQGADLVGLSTNYVGHPSDPLADKFDGNPVTHDEARWTRTLHLLQTHPELALNGVTWGWVDFALKASAAIQHHPRAGDLGPRLHIAAAGADSLADTEVSKTFARHAGGTCIVVQEAFHEILMEVDAQRAMFWATFDQATAALSR